MAPSEARSPPETRDPRAPGPAGSGRPLCRRRSVLLLGGAVLLFLAAVRLLGASVELLAPAVREALAGFLAGPTAVLGAGWLATYALLNGSVVAALALTLFAGGVVAAGDVYLLVAGSRLGSAAFVVVVGLLDHLHRRGRQTLRRAVGLGVLTFVVTHTVYLPAAGLELLTPWDPGRRLAEAVSSLTVTLPEIGLARPVAERLSGIVGAPVLIAASLALLYAAIRMADRGARALDERRLRER